MKRLKKRGKFLEILNKMIQMPSTSRALVKSRLMTKPESRFSKVTLTIIDVLDEIDKATMEDLNDLNDHLQQIEKNLEEELHQISKDNSTKD